MTKEQAKIILQSCRPGTEDDADPLVAEALDWAERDPELRTWWEAERAVDAAVRRKLKESTVPAGLAERIIGEGGGTRQIGQKAWGRYLALAAGLALLGLLAALFLPRGRPGLKAEFTVFREDMGEFLQVFPKLDLETEKGSEVRQWLAQKSWLTQVEIPPALQRFPSIGCREILWQGKRGALVCFMVDGEVIHLFMLPASAFANSPPGESADFKPAAGLATAAWQRGTTIYLAMTKGKRPFLEKYVRS